MSHHDSSAVRYSLLDDNNVDDFNEFERRTSSEGGTLEEVITSGVNRSGSRSSSSGGRHHNSTMNSFAGRLRGSQRITFLFILFGFFVIIMWLLSNNMESKDNNTDNKMPHTINYNQKISTDEFGEGGIDENKIHNNVPSAKLGLAVEVNPGLKPDGSKSASELNIHNVALLTDSIKLNCFETGDNQLKERSIAAIYRKLEVLKESKIEQCQNIWKIFDSILAMTAVESVVNLPGPFQEEVKGWLGHVTQLFEQVKKQVIFKVVNKRTFEQTVYNPLRANRPQSKPSIDPLTYIRNLTEETRSKCDFCQYKDHTAEDVFGRIENPLSASCSNTFKLAKFHGLFFPKQHNPLNLTLEQLQDVFLKTSKQWFEKAYDTDKSQRYPSLMWDTLPHAGASQVHPHIHGILDATQYVGGFESWHQVALNYFRSTGRSYWTDFVKVHFALGLGLSHGKAVIIVPLTGKKDHEFMILSQDLNEDVVALVYKVLQTYQNRLKVFCFSSGGVYPKLGEGNDGGMPFVFRFGSRGTCTSVGSDVSSLELYTINNINSDLAKTFNELQEEFSKPTT